MVGSIVLVMLLVWLGYTAWITLRASETHQTAETAEPLQRVRISAAPVMTDASEAVQPSHR